MKNNNLVRGAAALAVAGLVSKIIGAVYRIPLTNLLTAEGMGMYQLVFSIYALLLALTSSGLPLAVSRLVAERNAQGLSTKSVIKSATLWTLLFSVVIAGALAISGKWISFLQGNSSIYLCYAVIAPSIIFAGALAVLRGWFQGNFNIYPTAVTQLIEQALKLIFGLSFAYILAPRGVLYAVYGALLGVTLSEAVALVYILIVRFLKRKTAMRELSPITLSATSKELFKIAIPVAIGGLILPLSQFIDSILIVNLLKQGGLSTAQATANYGLFSGSVMSLVNMPIVITLSLAVVIVPAVSANRINHDIEGIILKSATSIKLSYVVGLPASILMFVYARPILTLLYPRLSVENIETSIMLLRIACFSAVFSAQTQIYNSLLQALDKNYTPVKNMFFAVALKTVVSVALLLFIGINGSAIASLALGVSATVLNVSAYNNLLGKNVKLVKNISTILLSSVIMTVIALGLGRIIGDNLSSMVIGGTLASVAYVLMLMILKVFEKGELDGVPLMKYLERLSVKIRFWEN